MKVVLLQTDIVWNDPQANVARAASLVAREPAADLYVLPEMWATGFAVKPNGIAEDEGSSVALKWMRQTAVERDCALCGSLSVRVEDGIFRNRHYFVTPDGCTFYDKHHLFTHGHEHDYYTPGREAVIASWRGFRFLLLTCYDLRFPVWARYGRAGEYDAIICVANWPASRQEAWEVLTKARAIENQSYLLAVNRVGDDAVTLYQGGTTVIDPIGRTMAVAQKNTEQPLRAELSMEKLLRRRSAFSVLDDRDV